MCPEEPQVCVEPLMPMNPSMAGLRCCWLCPPVCECAASIGPQQAEHTELLSVSMGGLCGAAELGGCCKGGNVSTSGFNHLGNPHVTFVFCTVRSISPQAVGKTWAGTPQKADFS